MSEVNKHISIPKNIVSNNDLEYEFLRRKGLDYIAKLSSDLWTDYNNHDPGVTVMQMLAYAITDLAARIEMPIEDLLAPEDKNAPKIEEQIFSASHILTSKPLTGPDYRKLFIDIEGVKNCWLKPYKKTVHVDCKNDLLSYDADDFVATHPDFLSSFDYLGLYSIIVDFDDLDPVEFDTDALRLAEYDRIMDEIKEVYHANRNLCEDLVEITKVDTHPISVCAQVDLLPEADEELVHALILNAIRNYFSPSLKFYSLRQMLDKGYSSEEIFNGPMISHGFIDPKELLAAELRTEVRLSDIIQLIMEIEGVVLIKEISINNCNDPFNEDDAWSICIEDGKKPELCDLSTFSYFKGVLPLNVNMNRVAAYQLEIAEAEKETQELAKVDMEIKFPVGNYQNTNETTTIQNDFPETYGIGRVGLPSRAETSRKSKALQLKGYLLFFDQVLANYFAHLQKVKDLLSVDSRLSRTYFTQVVEDIKDFDKVINDYPMEDNDSLTDKLLSDLDNNIARKNIILDHLISRFAERFGDYAFLMKTIYGTYAPVAVLNSKQDFLKDYHITAAQRGSAFNYFRQPESELWDTANVAGVQKRIARLCGIKNFNRRDLTGTFIEIYDLIDSDGNKVYRWRLKNKANEIILSASDDYPNPQQASKEIYLALLRIMETQPATIEEAFENIIKDEDEIGNFKVQVSPGGKFSFDIINLDAPALSVHRIIARQFSYYDNQEDLKAAILELIHFVTEDIEEEGMFIVEHILLRPDVTQANVPIAQFLPICTDNCESCQPVDPYSYRITIVLPGWTFRFSNPDFRNFMEDLIRKEIPAHVLARICWPGYDVNHTPEEENDMLHFELAYKEFLISKTDLEQAQDEIKLTNLIEALNQLNTIYPSGRLIDCDDEADELKGRIVLGRTTIGNL